MVTIDASPPPGTLDGPTLGVVRVRGPTSPGRQPAALRATAIGFVFQHFFLAEHQGVLEYVADRVLYAGGRHRSVAPAEAALWRSISAGTAARQVEPDAFCKRDRKLDRPPFEREQGLLQRSPMSARSLSELMRASAFAHIQRPIRVGPPSRGALTQPMVGSDRGSYPSPVLARVNRYVRRRAAARRLGITTLRFGDLAERPPERTRFGDGWL